MAFKDNPVGQLVRTDPAAASIAISASLKICHGLIAPTATALGANGATLRRWIAQLREKGFKVEPLRERGQRTEEGVEAGWKARWDGHRRRSKPPPKKPRKTGPRKKKFAKRA